MKNFNSNTDNSEEWLTPPELLKLLGPFDLDPCAPVERPWPMAKNHYTKLENGLSKPWLGRVWLNPPYGRKTFDWLEKLSMHKDGVALIFARTETQGFHSQIWEKADSVFFFKGRLKFHHLSVEQGGAANAPSCLVSYSGNDTAIIEKAIEKGMKGKLVYVNIPVEFGKCV